ncbi:efflux transporter, RND family, MFP subunit [Emticicia oligotrophica DSM 17448]|uniref:Efflux transporter, RND family, MFP subunit n=1 Tax=Emticicia oligotrophica (strain DSM 17448 / CIP 109782 / MTCC 6937 / GPTSA100-15) TaxID=929562 RepID=A0ABN4AMS1_EMTOG|nr:MULTISPECIES: efflux RND transporter periplasmic adaptor subunit [Emticicia]AFK03601.1 efflux transporter, RND family, MFP subunit [Emticicia oligotrophica DSM 17448]
MKTKHALLGICTVIIVSSCANKEEQKKQTVDYFPVTSPMVVDTTLHTDYVAEINAVQNVEIRARVKGYLDKIYIDEGKYVKQGQLLFSIHNPELSEEVIKASAITKSAITELRAAEIDLSNVKRLVEKNVVSNTELEAAKNKVEMMKAKVEEAKANESFSKIQITYTQIRAPFSGIVNRIPNKTGSLIEDGTLLTSISKNDEVFAYFDVSEKEYLNYLTNFKENAHNSSNVTLILANGEEHPFKGKIETTEGEIEPSTGNIAFRARFSNPEKVLKHGASGKIRLLKKYKNAMIIPQKATFEIQDRMYVYVIDAKNQVKSKPIISKHRMPHYYIVESGLDKGDKIIYEGIQNVKDGMTVKPQFIDMDEISKELTYVNSPE